MECRQVKQLLPLWIGQDLPDANSAADVASHLAQCPSCEKQRDGLQASLEVLQGVSVNTLPVAATSRSLWPQLVSRISDWERLNRRERFNGWIPASVMALAVALMIAVSLPSIQDEIFGSRAPDADFVDLFESVPRFDADTDLNANRVLDKRGPQGQPAFGTHINYKPDQW